MLQNLNTSCSFNIKVAKIAGINSAFILNNLYLETTNNEKGKKNYHDGYYWTCNSVKTLQEKFPYMTQKQIRTALKRLQDEGIIITDNYNRTKYDRTLWYAITYKGKCILQNVEDFPLNKRSVYNGK